MLTFDAHHPSTRSRAGRPRGSRTSTRVQQIKDEIALLEEQRPVGASDDEIEAMLNAVPDLREALAAATPQELAVLMETFDVTARYNHLVKTLELSVALAPELAETKRPPGGGRRNSGIAGARYERLPATGFRISECRAV